MKCAKGKHTTAIIGQQTRQSKRFFQTKCYTLLLERVDSVAKVKNATYKQILYINVQITNRPHR